MNNTQARSMHWNRTFMPHCHKNVHRIYVHGWHVTNFQPILPTRRSLIVYAVDSNGPSRAPELVQTPSSPQTRIQPPSQNKPPPKRNFNVKQLIKPFANLKLAIAELGVIAALSSIGTIIEQNKSYEYYLSNYPNEGEKVLGFVTADLIGFLQWDHIYSANYFLLSIALLGISLTACTITTQWPMVKVAQRWRYRTDEKSYQKLPLARLIPASQLTDLAETLKTKGYQIFVKEGALYAFKGLAGKVGPIGVHASMLMVMGGIVLGALGGYTGTAMITEGGEALVASLLRPASPIALPPSGASAALRVDDFRIDYRTDGSIRQFFTDMVVVDTDTGKELQKKTISVNQPLRFGGVTAYQTDWAMAALTVRSTLADGGAVNLPMASLEGQPGVNGKLYATFLPIDDTQERKKGAAPRGISFIARDLQSVVVYDSTGQFIGVRRPGSGKPLRVEGIDITIDDIVTSSGVELKVDPGVPLVYAGFGGMCITTVVSYLSHSQVWATQKGKDVVVGGQSNRAKVAFQIEMEEAIDGLPERL